MVATTVWTGKFDNLAHLLIGGVIICHTAVKVGAIQVDFTVCYELVLNVSYILMAMQVKCGCMRRFISMETL